MNVAPRDLTGWEGFMSVKSTEKFFCPVGRGQPHVWWAVRHRQGYNRCPSCLTAYTDHQLTHYQQVFGGLGI
jgi:hypothetical protein